MEEGREGWKERRKERKNLHEKSLNIAVKL